MTVKFKALGPRVKLKMLAEHKKERRSSIGIILEEAVTIHAEDSCHGVVVELGHTAYKGLKEEPWVKVGDHVLIMRYVGAGAQESDGFYRVVKDVDILAAGREEE